MNPKKHIWSITPEGLEQVEAYHSISMIEKLKGAVPMQEHPFKASAMYEDKQGTGRKGGKLQTVRVIPLEGVMVKKKSFEMMLMEYFFGIKTNTTRDVIEALNQAEADESISGVVISADTPGGTVDGIETLAQRIASMKKPVVGYVDGMACSAGIYALSQCDEIMAEESDTIVGSVGTVISFMNRAGWMNQNGFQLVKITADSSPDKQSFPNPYEEVTEEQVEQAKALLNPANTRFIEAVKAGRPKVKAEHLTGKIFNAAEAMGSLVDSIGTLQQAVDRVVYLSSKQSKKENKMEQSEASVVRDLMQAQIDDLKGQLTAKDGFLEEKESQISAISAELAAVKAEKETLSATVIQKEEAISALNQKLEETPADSVTAVNTREGMFATAENPTPWLNASWNTEAKRMAELAGKTVKA